MKTDEKMRVVVAGATGFIGGALAESLGERFHLIGLTRSSRTHIDNYAEVRKVDLFSKAATTECLTGAEVAIYLVHSMMPSARLVQASFEDLDLLCAENFASAAAANGIKHIVYVGGLQPADGATSRHLESRVEVEQALGSHGVPVTTLRAGLIVGGRGSSFQILSRLINRLPVMVCPSWTNTLTTPVGLGSVVWALGHLLTSPPGTSRVFDLGISEPMTYRQLLATAATSMGASRLFIPVPLVSPALSRLWVSLVTGAPRALVSPLISSLRHEMIARNDPEFRLEGEPQTNIKEVLDIAIQQASDTNEVPRAFRSPAKTANHPRVLSVQRMTLPAGRDAEWAAQLYLRWLPGFMHGLLPISVTTTEGKILFRMGKKGPTLLSLKHKGAEGPAAYEITGGLLAHPNPNGRLEFRTALDGRTLLVAVHEFEPKLPWWFYRCTQAVLHRWVMYRFSKFLKKQA